MFQRIPFFGTLPLCVMLLIGCGKADEEETEPANQAPTADAGLNQSLASNEPVSLDASGSFDPDGDPMSYRWDFDSVPAGSTLADFNGAFSVNDGTTPGTSFTPDVEGTYIVSLVVTDGLGLASLPDRMVVNVNSGDAPIAVAGDEQTVSVGETVALDGTGSSDSLERILQFQWSFVRLPSASQLETIESTAEGTATFEPDVSGIYLVALVVNNGVVDSAPDTTVIRVGAGASDVPVAVVGDDIAASDCTDIVLDGTDSYDPNGEEITYLWDLESRPDSSTATTGSFDDRTSAKPRFYADVDGNYTVSLAVHDGTSWSVPASVSIDAEERRYNTPPAVSPGSPRVVEGGEASCDAVMYSSSYICGYCEALTMTLGGDASVNDADGDRFTTLWTVSDGSADIDDPSSISTSVVLSGASPDMPGECVDNDYSFVLTTTDCTGAQSSETVTHTVRCCGYSDGVDDGGGSGGTGGPYGYGYGYGYYGGYGYGYYGGYGYYW